ncbi:MAG: hypothetical protein U0984_05350 [Prosthecobacter sp.]|nr:hypothetical protein [Prosthecobacter sp.]
MPKEQTHSKIWWLPPLLFIAAIVAGLVTACYASETAREVLAKAVMNIVGAVSTPFILEATVAVVGLCVVLAFNQWRLHKEGDGWVYLAQTEPDAASLAEGAETPPHRLDPVVLEQKPDVAVAFAARLAIVEGYLDLGLKREAVEHLNLLSPEERNSERAQALYVMAETKSA